MHAPDRDTHSNPSRAGWPLLPLLLVFAYALARTAWLSDDAFISFRSVEHMLAGRGPVWNAGERVQAFTHPLWFLMIAGARAATGEFYFSALTLSMVVSLGAISATALMGQAPLARRGLVLALCVSSRAFVDYGTSGLENPLSHLLLMLFVLVYLSPREVRASRYGALVLLAALGVLTRHDALLVYAPALAIEGLRLLSGRPEAGNLPAPPLMARCARLAGALLGGLVPFLAWEAFSIFYYGFPFPNTAYAKLSTGVPRAELLGQGIQYIVHALEHDTLTIATIVAGIAAGAFERNRRMRELAAGITIYVLYMVWIGGDFMAGRFLSLPFWGAALILMNATLGAVALPIRWIGAGLLFAVGVFSTFFIAPKAPLLSGPGYPNLPMEGRVPYDWRGIADERGGYYPWTGLLRAERQSRSPAEQPWAKMGRQFYEEGTPVVVQPAVGLMGWQAAERTMIVDQNALTDPLLARLPAMQSPRWRIGHFTRVPPPGYLATLVLGENRIADPQVSDYYEDLRLVTRGPLWSGDRLRAIARLNLKKQPELSDGEYYVAPPGYETPARRHYPAAWFEGSTGDRVMPGTDSFALYWAEPGRQPWLEIEPAPAADYDVQVACGGTELGRFTLKANSAGRDAAIGSRAAGAAIRIPTGVIGEGYDTVRFFPRGSAEEQRFRMIRRRADGEAAAQQQGSQEETAE